jgi:hypothetical protein
MGAPVTKASGLVMTLSSDFLLLIRFWPIPFLHVAKYPDTLSNFSKHNSFWPQATRPSHSVGAFVSAALHV